jgi:hypothetical protein
MERPDWAPEGVDLDRPSAARVYDYFLGGVHNFAVDRELAEQIARMTPNIGDTMRANRSFLRGAVRFLVGEGITQFLDIGSGIPTVGNVHEVAQQADSGRWSSTLTSIRPRCRTARPSSPTTGRRPWSRRTPGTPTGSSPTRHAAAA